MFVEKYQVWEFAQSLPNHYLLQQDWGMKIYNNLSWATLKEQTMCTLPDEKLNNTYSALAS